MGQNHVRVYNQLPNAELVGITDADDSRAQAIADRYETEPLGLGTLLERAEAVSIAVPTPFHYDVTTTCLDAGVATLVEKPLVDDLEAGRRLRERANRVDVPLQVGHIERFNPAVRTLADVLTDLTIVDVSTRRLGPPPDREIAESAVLDLMIHDIDVVCTLLDKEPTDIQSTGVYGNRHATALLEFDSGPMATMTASRLTQRKVRTLEITAEECLIELDYIDQSIEIHRNSIPEYVENGEGVRFRHESIVERPHVPTAEPLKLELESFLDAARGLHQPEVTVDDGLTALSIAQTIERLGNRPQATVGVAND